MEIRTARQEAEARLLAPFAAQWERDAARATLDAQRRQAADRDGAGARQHLADLQDRLADAEAVQTASAARLAVARGAYERAGAQPSQDVLERMRQREAEAQDAARAVTLMRQAIAEAETHLAARSQRDEQEAQRAHARRVWGEVAAEGAALAEALAAFLDKQQAAFNKLVDAGAFAHIPPGTTLEVCDSRGYDELSDALARYIKAVKAAALRDEQTSRKAHTR